MPFDMHMKKAVEEVGELKLRTAFRQAIFVYGTTGVGSIVGQAAKEFLNHAKDPEQSTVSFYDPGPRTAFALANQMMDLYYGQKGTTLHEHRDPTIGTYVHRAMRFRGNFEIGRAGWATYQETYNNPLHEGWRYPTGSEKSALFHRTVGGRVLDLTGTQYMSLAIREAIFEMGGTLVFEGATSTTIRSSTQKPRARAIPTWKRSTSSSSSSPAFPRRNSARAN